MNKEVVIVSAVRTPIGDFLGALKTLSSIQLGIIALEAAIKRADIDPNVIEEVAAGNCFQASSPGNVARHIQLGCGIPASAAAVTVNQQCPSSMRAMEVIVQQIALGKIDVGAVVGTESMSNAPYLLLNAREGYRMGDGDRVVDAMLYNGLHCGFINDHMGMTAENVADMYGITRLEQDELALESHRRALKAIDKGYFKSEIVPITLKKRTGDIVIDTDEHPKETTIEKLGKMRTVFKKDGTVTAGNASGVNDGAAALILMSAEKAKAMGIKPLARVIATASGGVEPRIMGMGVVPAVERALNFAGLQQSDIDYWEINEAFAAQYLGVNRELKLAPCIVNGNGSGIGLGHPVGCTGARLIVTLIHEMQRRNVSRGCASLCAGGGPAAAAIIELV
jgi:acetyl-CoA C-acetyltransferase